MTRSAYYIIQIDPLWAISTKLKVSFTNCSQYHTWKMIVVFKWTISRVKVGQILIWAWNGSNIGWISLATSEMRLTNVPISKIWGVNQQNQGSRNLYHCAHLSLITFSQWSFQYAVNICKDSMQYFFLKYC